MAGFSDCKPDAAVLARARRGDMKAHEALYGSYSRPAYTLALRILADAALADEVLQDTAMEVMRNIGAVRHDAAFGGWVKRIATNKCLAYLRSAWHRKGEHLAPEAEADAEGSAGERFGSDDLATRTADRESLERALASLSPTARAVVWLYDVEGYSHREIGALMGKSVSFSKSSLARAHEQLRASLGPDYTEVSTCMPRPSNF